MSRDASHYIKPNQEAIVALLKRQIQGPVVMLNLLRFKKVADYSDFPELAPSSPISGEDAYQRYIAHAKPFISEIGGSLIFLGRGGRHLIGPVDECWDWVMLVRQPSVNAFLAFTSNEAYLAGLGHRTAALEDSRLLPIIENELGDQNPAPDY